MIRILLLFVSMVFAVTAMAAPPPSTNTGNFKVRANPSKADGGPWRGMPAGFGGIPHLPYTATIQQKNAPSLILCTVSVTGNVQCPGQKGTDAKGRPTSPCHMSYDCDFEDIELPPGDLFGVIVISPGIIFTNFVDAVVFARRDLTTKDPMYVEMNRMMHDHANRMAPTKSRDEIERRDRPFQLFPTDECAAAVCELRQSQMKFKMQ